jgi:hypothetical protein
MKAVLSESINWIPPRSMKIRSDKLRGGLDLICNRFAKQYFIRFKVLPPALYTSQSADSV